MNSDRHTRWENAHWTGCKGMFKETSSCSRTSLLLSHSFYYKLIMLLKAITAVCAYLGQNDAGKSSRSENLRHYFHYLLRNMLVIIIWFPVSFSSFLHCRPFKTKQCNPNNSNQSLPVLQPVIDIITCDW